MADDLPGLISNQLSQLEQYRKSANQIRDMLDGIFQNDATYRNHDTAVKDAQKIRSQTKKQLLKQSSAVGLLAKLADLKTSSKGLNDSLSQNLLQYRQTSGQTSIETPDGQVREIVYTAKLVKKLSE